MFESASAYGKTKLVGSFVKCVKSSRRVMSRELCCVISSSESSFSLIVNGELNQIFIIATVRLWRRLSSHSRQLCLSNAKALPKTVRITRFVHSFILLVDDFDINCSQIAFGWYETAFAYEKTLFSLLSTLKPNSKQTCWNFIYETNTTASKHWVSESKWEGNITSFVALLCFALRRLELSRTK